MISLTLSDLCLQETKGLDSPVANVPATRASRCQWIAARSLVADLCSAHTVLDGKKVRRRQERIFQISSMLPRGGKRPRSSAFLWPAYTSCCPVHPVTGSPAPSATAWPCPGYPGLTPVSLFSHALFCHFVEEPVLFDFPRKELHFHSQLTHTLAHRTGRS